MRNALAIIAAVVLVPWVAHCDESTIPSVRFLSAQVLPAGWHISSVDAPSVPYGLVKKPGESSGVAVTLAGPKQTKGRMGEPAIESFTVYVMARGFVGDQPPPPGSQFTGLKLLGQTSDGCPVYVIWWSQIESWPDWEKSIHDYLVKKDPNKSVEPKPTR